MVQDFLDNSKYLSDTQKIESRSDLFEKTVSDLKKAFFILVMEIIVKKVFRWICIRIHNPEYNTKIYILVAN